MKTNMKTAFSLVIAVAALALSACGGGKCEQVCEQFNACDIKHRDHDVDCQSFCSDELGFEERAKVQSKDTCHDQFDAYLTCFGSKDVCDADATSACDDSLTAWADCMTPYCADSQNATDPACVDNGDGTFSPALQFGF